MTATTGELPPEDDGIRLRNLKKLRDAKKAIQDIAEENARRASQAAEESAKEAEDAFQASGSRNSKDDVENIWEKIRKGAKEKVGAVIDETVDSMKAKVKELGISPELPEVRSVFKRAVELVTRALKAVVEELVSVFRKIWDGIVAFWEGVKEYMTKVGRAVEDVVSQIQAYFAGDRQPRPYAMVF
ncbi:hypothetical protein FQN54_000616 [Arachnomyces sp. PD_36]|nr:hypothetical protein FQN54_000616 [Arachnomyces sp. PD_36]